MSDEVTEDAKTKFLEDLRAELGVSGKGIPARDPVNQPMIRHWCDAMLDQNPVYTDPEFARNSIHGEIVAPPAMLNAWGMRGLVPPPPRSEMSSGNHVYAKLDAAGFTSVVATNSDHAYTRYLKLGDQVIGSASTIDISGEKKTALGIGHFVTTRTEYCSETGEKLGSMLFRILKFKPGTGRMPSGSGEQGAKREAPRRPKPSISRDTKFFWDGVDAGELRIQKCDCGALHHPPMVRCPACGVYELGYIVSSGRGRIYSLAEPCHPKVPAFDYPLIVGLVELEAVTRLLSTIIDIEADKVNIGMEVEVAFQAVSPGYRLPLFRPVRPARSETTLRFDAVEEGMELAAWPIPITPTLIVSTAIASRDYQDVHHDRDLAVRRGSPDIFMNILTSGGLSATYVTDWAGPEARMRNLKIRLGVPNYPYDTMTMTGRIEKKEIIEGSGRVTVSVRGANRMGNHLTGSVDLELPIPR